MPSISQVVKPEGIHSEAVNSNFSRDHTGDRNEGLSHIGPYEAGSEAVD